MIKERFKKNFTQTNYVGIGGELYDFMSRHGFDMQEDVAQYYLLYKNNPDIRSCISDKSYLIFKGGYGLQLNGEDVDVPKELEDFFEDISEDKYDWVYHLDISGNLFIYKLRNITGKIIGYQVIDSRAVTVQQTKDGIFYRIATVDGQKIVPKDDMLHVKEDRDPVNSLLGISKLAGIATDVIADREASRSNMAWFKNNAIPAGLLVLDDKYDYEQTKTIFERMRKNWEGGDNKHKVGMLTGVKEYLKLQDTVADMEYQVLREFTTNKIASAFKVPPTRLGQVDVKYSNYQEIYTTYIDSIIKRYEVLFSDMVQDMLNEILPGYTFVYWSENITDEDRKTDNLIKQVENGLVTINEARVELGYELYTNDNADMPLYKGQKLDDIGLNIIQENAQIN